MQSPLPNGRGLFPYSHPGPENCRSPLDTLFGKRYLCAETQRADANNDCLRQKET